MLWQWERLVAQRWELGSRSPYLPFVVHNVQIWETTDTYLPNTGDNSSLCTTSGR